MLQITLVSDKHDDSIRIRMVAQFLEPPINVGVGWLFGDVIDKKRAYRTAVVTAISVVISGVTWVMASENGTNTHADVMAR